MCNKMFILYIKILFYERSNFNLPRLYNTKFDLNDLNNFVSVLEKNSFAFDWSGFDSLAHHILFYDGFLSDVEISEKQMNKLLHEYSKQLETLSNEYIKKIIQHKKH